MNAAIEEEGNTDNYFYEIQPDTLVQTQQSQIAASVANAGFSSNIRQAGYPSYVTLFIICGVTLFAVIKYNFGKNIKEAFLSFFNYRQAMRMFDERRESDRHAIVLSNILFSLVIGIFVPLVFNLHGTSQLWDNYLISISIFSAITGLLYILKAQIWQLMGVIFIVRKFSKIYIYNMFLHNQIIGLIIFPLVAVMPYVAEIISQYIMYGVIIVLILSYLCKLWRIFQIINSQNVSILYFILYLCTLEFLPLLLLAKCCKLLSENIIICFK